MSDKLRVHTLSKELGVTSKAIIQKCKVEEVEGVTNHMSTVSAGLAETIREWFSDSNHGTAVEEAAPVDLEKARSKAKTTRKRKKKVAAKEGEEQVVAEEKEAPEKKTVKKKAVKKKAAKKAVSAAEAEAAEPAVEVAPEIEGEAAATTDETVAPELPATEVDQPAGDEGESAQELAPAAKAPKPARPLKPKEVKPAGPQNVPQPAQMRGPKVIGFAKPDDLPAPVPRTPQQPKPAAGPGQMTPDDGPGTRRGGGKGRPGRDWSATKSRRSRSPRRSNASREEVGERLREWNDRDLLERKERLEAASGRGIHARRAQERKSGAGPSRIAPRKTEAEVFEPIILHELAAATGVGMAQLIPKLVYEHNLGMVNRNTVVPNDIAELVLFEFGVELKVVKPKTALEKLREEFDARERPNPKPRPPVVTMLGHVDHGKTSLLDAIRKTSVADGEAGGITQHIGAYQVEHGDLKVTFLDTPGHEAFTAMRARGAHMTDVVVLVVAADDGLMPQTIEAINHAKAAEVTIIVALNKIDLPGVDINKVYGQLAEMELTPTEWGGDVDVVKTSATTGEGIEELIEHLAVLTDLLSLQADPTVPASGAVIEAEMKQGIGPVTHVLVKEGQLETGDFVVCGPAAGRVRRMTDDRGRPIKKALPGMPVEIAGLDEVPGAGDMLYCVNTLQQAKDIADETQAERRAASMARMSKVQTLEDLLQQREDGQIPELNMILRADVQGSIDALRSSLEDIPSDEVKLNFLHIGIGSITESDVVLAAAASGALIVGFNVTADVGAQRQAELEGVDIRTYRVIYDVIDDVRRALEGLLPTDKNEEERGKAEVREIFHVSKVGVIAGCYVTEGTISRTNYLRVVRDSQIIVPTADDAKHGRHRAVDSLRRFKDDAREVRAGMECGIRVQSFDDLKPGDILEAYDVVEIARTLA